MKKTKTKYLKFYFKSQLLCFVFNSIQLKRVSFFILYFDWVRNWEESVECDKLSDYQIFEIFNRKFIDNEDNIIFSLFNKWSMTYIVL